MRKYLLLLSILLFTCVLEAQQFSGVAIVRVNGDTTQLNLKATILSDSLTLDWDQSKSLSNLHRTFKRSYKSLDPRVYYLFLIPSEKLSTGKWIKKKERRKEIYLATRNLPLAKSQWDAIHNPEWVVGMFEDDQESSLQIGASGRESATRLLEMMRCAYVNETSTSYINNDSRYSFDFEDFELLDGSVLSELKLVHRKYGTNFITENYIVVDPKQSVTIEQGDQLATDWELNFKENGTGWVRFGSDNKADLEKLLVYLKPDKSTWKREMVEVVSRYDLSDQEKLKELAYQYPCALGEIEDVDIKFNALKLISEQGWIEGMSEQVIGDILRSVTDGSSAESLIVKLDADKTGILKKFDEKVGRSTIAGITISTDEEHRDYYAALTKLYITSGRAASSDILKDVGDIIGQQAYNSLLSNDLSIAKDLSANNVMLWSDPGYVKFFTQTGTTAIDYDDFNFTENGQISFTVDHINWTGSDYDFSASYNSFDPILVILLTSSGEINPYSTSQSMFRGQAMIIPAISLNHLNSVENMNTFMRYVDGIATVIPVGFAIKSAKYVYLGTEIALFSAQQYFEDYGAELNQTVEGQYVLRAWMVFNLMYTLKEMGGGNKGLSKAFENLTKKLDNYSQKVKTDKTKEFVDKLKKLFKSNSSGDNLANSWKSGWKKERVLDISKGERPNPSTYLDQSYIDNHISKFDGEGGAFIVVKSWTEGGNPKYASMPPRKFVGLRSEMDNVILKYKSEGNDWRVLRDELNLGSDTNLAGEEIFYIKIKPSDNRFRYDIPDGNEGGAIPGEWVPGGRTKNGTTEAALIGSENVIHNKDINQLLDFFGVDSWEKIK